MLPKHLYHACIACGLPRSPEHYAVGDMTCLLCHRCMMLPDTRAKRTSLASARRQAHAALLAPLVSPYRVRCAHCGRDQAPAHYPWLPGQAVRGDKCKSCHGAKAGRPRIDKPEPAKPYGPTARRTAARRLARRLLAL